MGEEHSMMCENMSFTCEPEVPEESVCDGIMGDVGCVCEEGTVKTQTEMTRRILAVQGESLYCPENSCLMEKQGMESGFAGPMDQFYECYNIESGETSEGNLLLCLSFRAQLVKLNSFVIEKKTIQNFIQVQFVSKQRLFLLFKLLASPKKFQRFQKN